MSSGEPTDVTISMRVPGAEMKLGKLVSGPTGQLVIDTQEEATVQPSTTDARIEVIMAGNTESISRPPLILTSSEASSGKSPQAKSMDTSMETSSKPRPWKKP
jgi:hypothetical protein